MVIAGHQLQEILLVLHTTSYKLKQQMGRQLVERTPDSFMCNVLYQTLWLQ